MGVGCCLFRFFFSCPDCCFCHRFLLFLSRHFLVHVLVYVSVLVLVAVLVLALLMTILVIMIVSFFHVLIVGLASVLPTSGLFVFCTDKTSFLCCLHPTYYYLS